VIAQKLLQLGADLRVHDDHLPTDFGPVLEPRRVSCDVAEIAAADLVVILVDHPDLPYDDICAHAAAVLDTKGVLRGREFVGEVL
jgi:UDP-N-acetyl-D-mannosaminuronate dehydrogenase